MKYSLTSYTAQNQTFHRKKKNIQIKNMFGTVVDYV